MLASSMPENKSPVIKVKKILSKNLKWNLNWLKAGIVFDKERLE